MGSPSGDEGQGERRAELLQFDLAFRAVALRGQAEHAIMKASKDVGIARLIEPALGIAHAENLCGLERIIGIAHGPSAGGVGRAKVRRRAVSQRLSVDRRAAEQVRYEAMGDGEKMRCPVVR
ncbi:hypothetical protein Sj15T_10200 [Sphingobium sp. TA15]|nr:hypothetical protein Sj15T_10200 [Sphingobium sp. TA15]